MPATVTVPVGKPAPELVTVMPGARFAIESVMWMTEVLALQSAWAVTPTGDMPAFAVVYLEPMRSMTAVWAVVFTVTTCIGHAASLPNCPVPALRQEEGTNVGPVLLVWKRHRQRRRPLGEVVDVEDVLDRGDAVLVRDVETDVAIERQVLGDEPRSVAEIDAIVEAQDGKVMDARAGAGGDRRIARQHHVGADGFQFGVFDGPRVVPCVTAECQRDSGTGVLIPFRDDRGAVVDFDVIVEGGVEKSSMAEHDGTGQSRKVDCVWSDDTRRIAGQRPPGVQSYR